MTANEISGFDAGNDLKADAPLQLVGADSEFAGRWKSVTRCRAGSTWVSDRRIHRGDPRMVKIIERVGKARLAASTRAFSHLVYRVEHRFSGAVRIRQ